MLLYIIKQYFQRNIKYELNIFIQEANELKLTDDLSVLRRHLISVSLLEIEMLS